MLLHYNKDKIIIQDHPCVPYVVFTKSIYLILGSKSDILCELLKTHIKELVYLKFPSLHTKKEAVIDLFFQKGRVRYMDLYTLALRLLQKLYITHVERLFDSFSEIQRRHILLALALFQNGPYMLLEHPTKYLDGPTIHWLIETLKSYQGILFVTSEHMEFINELAVEIIWVDDHFVTWYSSYEEMKTSIIEADLHRQWRYTLLYKLGRRESTMMNYTNIYCLHEPIALSGLFIDDEKTNIRICFGDKCIVTGRRKSGKTRWLHQLKIIHPMCRVFYLSNVDFSYATTYKYSMIDFIHEKTSEPDSQIIKILNKFHLIKETLVKHLDEFRLLLMFAAIISLDRPHLLIIDEFLDNFSLMNKEMFYEMIHYFKGSVLCITHDLYWAQRRNYTIIHFS